MNKIAIRADANEQIAMGHLMRCMSVAFQLKKSVPDVIFILAEDYAKHLVQQNGFTCICLKHIYAQMEQELDELEGILRQHGVSCLLVDSYDISYAYMKRLQKICKTVYIDDLKHFAYPADLTVHYTYGAEQLLKTLEGSGKKPSTRYLLGIRYAPLREEFSGEAIRIREHVEQILITTGGTDPYDITIGILEKIQDFPDIKKQVVAGKFYHNLPLLREMAQKDASIQISHDIPDICRVMKQCDVAVSAGGGTLAELCACGVPTVCFTLADNQLDGAKAYADAGMMLYAGDVRKDRASVLNRMTKLLEMLQGDLAQRKRMGAKAKEIVDGRGASRIAEEMLQLIK
ncbi:MAG: UDP-2,4-diacetamido-2,4,6-trideoxy-beta-L-altropyranose hydrolase [Eubacterium sp.]|nr:UDP-2,4-diacetamido-2,4,6-trideoxy-beta-L-altropyranose hydrolase [Eubacterium sp.]